MVAALIAPAHDLAEVVLRARVHGVDLRLGTAVIVREGEVDLARRGIDGAPFGAVHLGCPGLVSGKAGIHQDIGEIGEAVLRRQPVLAGRQGQPLARAICVEPRDMERTLVQQAAIGGRGIIGLRGNELVDVFEARVVARVAHHGLAGGGRREHDPLVCEAAERRALLRHGSRIIGVELDHPAESIGLVAVVFRRAGALRGGVEARELVGTANMQ